MLMFGIRGMYNDNVYVTYSMYGMCFMHNMFDVCYAFDVCKVCSVCCVWNACNVCLLWYGVLWYDNIIHIM